MSQRSRGIFNLEGIRHRLASISSPLYNCYYFRLCNGVLTSFVKAALIKEDCREEKWLYCESEAKAAVASEMKQSFKKRFEDVFRFMKPSLGLRPVYHQKEHRVDGHLWITIMAYHLIQNCLYQLNNK